MTTQKTALVLGGGGHYGISFETGYLRGLFDAGINLRHADIILGSSAGSQVGAVMASNKDWDTIWHDQIETDVDETTPISEAGMADLFKEYNNLPKISHSDKEWIDKLGEISKRTHIDFADNYRLDMVQKRIGDGVEWTDSLRVATTEIGSSKRVVFDKTSNVALLSALAASSALPGVWPAVNINNHQYFDGGSYSMDNPDLIEDADNVIVISNNLPILAPYKTSDLVTKMNNKGIKTTLLVPGDAVVAILNKYGNNTMESALRSEVANAARKQGQADAQKLADLPLN